MATYRPWAKSEPELAAEKLLLRHWDMKIPVDVFAIAEKQGARVEPSEELVREGLSGKVCINDGDAIIYYNPQEPSVRQRFTVAHELGHLVLGHVHGGECHRDPTKNYNLQVFDPNERDANVFAAHLMMPPAAVRIAVNRMKGVSLEKLARLFGVSQKAMEIRLKSMGILPEWM